MTALQRLSLGSGYNDTAAEPIRDALAKLDTLMAAAIAAGWTSDGPARPVVDYATATALATNTYSSGVITASSNGALSVDGASPSVGARILVKDEAAQSKNGVYVVTTVGNGSAPFVLTRADDFSTAAELAGAIIAVQGGSVNAERIFECTSDASVTIGVGNITFAIASVGTLTAAIWGYLSGTSTYMGGLLATASRAALVSALALAFTDLSGAIAVAQMGSASGAPASIEFAASAVNFNSANSDTAIAIALPSGYTRFLVNQCRISGASAPLTTATCSLWTGASGTGTAIVASGSAITVSSASENTNNNAQNLSLAVQNTQSYRLADVPMLYFRVQNAQGSAATGNVHVVIIPQL